MKTFSKSLIYMLILGALISLFYLVFIKPGMFPCGWIDTYFRDSKCIQRLELDDSALSVFFTPDSKTLVALSIHDKVYLWQVANGDLVYVLENKTPETITSMALNTAGTVLAIAFYDRVELWQIRDGTLLSVLQGDAGFDATVFGPNELIAATGSPVGTINLWQIKDGTTTLSHTLTGHTDQVWELAFSSDGAILASGSVDGTIRLWRVSDGVLLHILEGEMGWIESLALTPDGKVIAAGGDKIVQLWRVSDGMSLYTLEGHTGNWINPNLVRSLAFSPDGTLLASAGMDNMVKIWQMSDGILLCTIEHGNPVSSVTFSPSGLILASAESFGPIRLFDIQQCGFDRL